MNTLTINTNKPSSNNLTRDQRVAIQTLRRHGLSQQAIARELGLALRQAQYSCERGTASDAKIFGRPPVLNEIQVDELENFVRCSREDRLMSFLELSMYPFSHWNVGKKAIQNALLRRGYRRCISQRKPPLSDINRRKRVLFAQTHLSWTEKQWSQIPWTDESWITGGQHTRVWVTRKVGEIFDDNRVSSRFVTSSSWMFWGSLFGTQKGPILV